MEAVAFICNFNDISGTKFASEVCLLCSPVLSAHRVCVYYQATPLTVCDLKLDYFEYRKAKV